MASAAASPPQERPLAVEPLLSRLKECGRKRNLEKGKQVHAEAIRSGHASKAYVASALINMYAKCGSMAEARRVFDGIQHPNVVSWSTLLHGYADNGQDLTALDLFRRMLCAGPAPNSVTFLAALKACAALAVKGGASRWAECRERSKEIHELAVKSGCGSELFVQNTLIDMYAKCGSIADARRVFDSMKQPDVVSWNNLILGYADTGEGLVALDLFRRMTSEGIPPGSVTFVAALKACTSHAVKTGSSAWVECRQWGVEIQELAVKNGCDSELFVQNTLIDMFANCGSMVEAHQVFRGMKNPDVVSWTILILGYAENGRGRTALDLFTRMRSKGLRPNSVTFLAALNGCTSLAAKETSEWEECKQWGKILHILVVDGGKASDRYIQNAFLDMYSKCGSMVDAHQVFDSMKPPDIVSWNALILGYAENGQGLTSLDLFIRMKSSGSVPSSVTFVGALKACGLVGSLEFGRTIHAEIEAKDLNIVLVNCLVDFYARCGSLVEAQSVFELHSGSGDIITWTALLAGFSRAGDHESVFRLLERMQDRGLLPNSVTLLCTLTCCSHAGLVEKGKECFQAMPAKYGITPRVEHYSSMVDIFGRANRLDDAMALLNRMPCSPDEVTWTAAFSACRKWKNVEIGRLAFQALVYINHRDVAAHLVMGQIYASRGMLHEQEIVMRMRESLK